MAETRTYELSDLLAEDIELSMPQVQEATAQARLEEMVDYPEELDEKQREVFRFKTLKEKYYYGLAGMESSGMKGPDDADTIGAMPYIAEDLLNGQVWVTDMVRARYESADAEEFDHRHLQEAELMQARFDYLKDELGKLGGNDMVELSMQDLLDRFAEFAKGKQIYATDGLEAVEDMLSDSLLAQDIIERSAVDMLLRAESIMDFLEKRGFELPHEDVNIDRARFLGEFLRGLDDDDQNHVLEAYKKDEIEKVKDFFRLKAAAGSIISSCEFKDLDVAKPNDLPVEMQLVLHEYPELAYKLENLRENGVEVALRTRTNTAPEVIEAIHRISTLSQHNFTINWLKSFIEDGKVPNISISKEMKDRAEQMKGEGEEVDLEKDLETIKAAVGEYKKIIPTIPTGDLTKEQQLVIDEINEALRGVNQEYASHRMQFDLSDEQTSEAQDLIKKMMMIGPITHGLEHANLGFLAKLFASSADDLMGEYAEIKALLGAGFSKSDVLKRLRIAVPVFGLATYGSAQVETLLKHDKSIEAGAVFGASAVALSMATSLQSMKMYKNEYEELVREGKITRSFVARNKEFQTLWGEFSQGVEDILDNPIKTRELIREVLDSLQDSILNKEDKEYIIAELEGIDGEGLEKMMKEKMRGEAWKKAIAQDFNNPVRMGIMAGSLLAPVVGTAVGAIAPKGLENGFVLAGIGAVETMTAGITVMLARKISDFKYKNRLQKRLDDMRERDQAAYKMAPEAI